MNMTIFFEAVFRSCCSLIIAQGRATLAATIQIIVLLSKLALDPLMIFVFKAPINAMGLSESLISIIASVSLLIAAFCGKFSAKPKLTHFIKKFSSHFWDFLKLCIPVIFQITIGVVIPIMTSAILVKAAINEGHLTEFSTCFSAAGKVLTMLSAIMQGSISGLAPSGTYAFHKGNIKRMYKLAGCSIIMPAIIGVTVCILMVFFPKKILVIWISDNILEMAPYVAPKLSFLAFLEPITIITNQLLFIFKKKILVTIIPIVKAIFLLSSAAIFYWKYPAQPSKILFCYPIQDLSCLLMSIIFFVFTYRRAESYHTIVDNVNQPLVD
ncbi:hypothetical protein TVAG_377920 [Trichomonas vaginalis G3]|uniref:MatE family protein n=1 Tax=Trichomonas vaginalis (strain ATCC PRA-98 / G3) TaxID=412133 RepID=A2DAY3_TRIV3|nr:multidrug resistance protein YPNP-related family [Trichomonas vaginalis G3]EAY22313.1 hypothetical protein TVAG_377920 [Trichomonas vaginalis G3]KAI5518251.1 multidrug resistance protein YPNP-related family [Trichomonas vaginalis G3]|eukprot:XP_001583299.1 hypothetical protein [Trichomonas vaginalis G3]